MTAFEVTATRGSDKSPSSVSRCSSSGCWSSTGIRHSHRLTVATLPESPALVGGRVGKPSRRVLVGASPRRSVMSSGLVFEPTIANQTRHLIRPTTPDSSTKITKPVAVPSEFGRNDLDLVVPNSINGRLIVFRGTGPHALARRVGHPNSYSSICRISIGYWAQLPQSLSRADRDRTLVATRHLVCTDHEYSLFQARWNCCNLLAGESNC